MKKIKKFNHTFRLDIGSSSHHPERHGGITTCDIRYWIKIDNKWHTLSYNSNFEEIENNINNSKDEQELLEYINTLI